MDDMMDVDAPDQFTETSETFLNWLKQNGTTISDKIQLADLRSRNAGRGAVAKEAIAADETLFTIPRTAILTHQFSNRDFAGLAQIDDEWIKLIAIMMHEYILGSDSKWKPYFDVLPNEFDTLMFWSEDELQYLEGSTVVNKIGRETADKAFEEQILPLVSADAGNWKAKGLSNNELRTLFHRMGSAIMAYAFDLEGPPSGSDSNRRQQQEEDGWEEDEELLQKGMVPLADMLNANADLNNARLFYEEGTVVMKSIKDIQLGDEIFNDYGSLPRSDLLRRYGYVTEQYAKYDVAELRQDTILQAAVETLNKTEKDVKERVGYLEDQLGTEDLDFDISRVESEDGPWTEELAMVLNAITLPKDEFEKLQKKERIPKGEPSKSSLELLYSVLVRRRAMYPSGEAPQPADDAINAHRRDMAKQVIDGEKSVLFEAAQHVRKLLGEDKGKKRKADNFDDEVERARSASKKR